MAAVTDVTNEAASLAYNFIQYGTPALTPETVGDKANDSHYIPPIKPHRVHPNVPGYTDVGPEMAGQDLGTTVYFKWLNNETDAITKAYLYVHLNELQNLTGNECYPDDPLCHIIESIEMQVAGRTTQILYGDQIHFDNLVERDPTELARRYQLQHAGLSPAQRRAEAVAAGGGFWAKLELPFFFGTRHNQAFHNYLTQATTRFVIKYRTAVASLQNTGAATPIPPAGQRYVVDQFLRFRVVALHEKQKSLVKNQVKAMGRHGLLYKIQDIQRVQAHAVTAGATNTNIDISNFTKHVYRIQGVIRPAANLVANVQNNDRWALTDCSTMYIEAAGKRLLPEHDDDTLKYIVNGEHFRGMPGDAIYNGLFTDFPDVHHDSMGGLDFSLMGNPRWWYTWSTPLGANQECDLWAYCHNMVKIMDVGGLVSTSQLYAV